MPCCARPVLALLVGCLAMAVLGAGAGAATQPRLVLQITVDQLRGDMPLRFRERFGPDGFRYLMDRGAVFTGAHYRHATTRTAVGHATLFTGGHAAQHGIVSNKWTDAETGADVYCVADARHSVIGGVPDPNRGASPRNLTSTTIGDELVLATNGRSRVFAVSLKDRAAIIPGGHLGKAFWYDKDDGRMVTSTYYYDSDPDWLAAWNADGPADRYWSATWTLSRDPATYLYAETDDRASEVSRPPLGRTFPHPLAPKGSKSYYGSLLFTPMADEMTLDFVQTLVRAERIGQGESTDFLAISFSATDLIGHAFGPNSLEAEENLLRLDATLARLFAFIDAQVGLEQTLIVLSSDHGAGESPEHMKALGFPAGRLIARRVRNQVNAALRGRFGTRADLVAAYKHPNLYLDLQAVRALGRDVAEVERALAEAVLKVPGVALALTRSDLLFGRVPNTLIAEKVLNSFHPDRSGHVLVVLDPHWQTFRSPGAMAVTHVSPYAYDTYVPIMIAGPGVGPKIVRRSVAPSDVAPTIAAYLGINPPSGAVGTPLPEALPAALLESPSVSTQ